MGEPRAGQETNPSSGASMPSIRSVLEEDEDEDDFILADIVQGLETAQAMSCGSE